MGRKSKLSDEQWATVGKRLLEGESAYALAREFEVSEATIRSHFERKGQRSSTVQKVAGLLFEAETALKQLPEDAQVSAINLAGKLKSISESLACAAENSARTTLRLTALANTEVQKVDDAQPLMNGENLKNAVLLTKAANEAAHIPLNLLSANREAVKRIADEPPPPDPDQALTPERMTEGARRLAFVLHRAAALETN